MSGENVICIIAEEARENTREAIDTQAREVQQEAENFIAGTCNPAIQMASDDGSYQCEILTEDLGSAVNTAVLRLLKEMGYGTTFDYARDFSGNITKPEKKKFTISWHLKTEEE